MKKFLVADSGGTKTKAIVFDENENILGTGSSGGGNANLMPPDAALQNVISASEMAIAGAGLTNDGIDRAYLYIPGFKNCLEDFISKTKITATLLGETSALKYSCLNGGDGVIVLVGTGSFAVAFESGVKYKVGGWGTVFGDDGSGYDIGVMALRTCAALYDMDETCPLQTELINYYGVEHFIELLNAVYQQEFVREKIAGICKIVCAMAADGDEICKGIIDSAVSKMCMLADQAYRKSGATGRRAVTLAGGVANAGEIVTNAFAERIRLHSNGNLIYRNTHLEPIYGGMKYLLADCKNKS